MAWRRDAWRLSARASVFLGIDNVPESALFAATVLPT